MQQFIFLLTSLNGMHKPNFSTQLQKALQRDAQVSVLVAMVDFEAVWTVRQYLNQLARNNPRVKDVRLVTLAEMFADEPGLALTAEERHAISLDNFEQRLFADNQEQVKRYLDEGHMVAELRQVDDETPMVLRQYQADQLAQVDTYGLNGKWSASKRFNERWRQPATCLIGTEKPSYALFGMNGPWSTFTI